MSLFEQLSSERKTLQEEGRLPEWFTTVGWQAFKKKYLYKAETFEDQINRIVQTLGRHLPPPVNREYFQRRWKECIMDAHAYLSTPVLANTGTKRGLSVSCSGGYIGDSIWDFGDARTEAAVLSQEGFGTSAYLGGIRHRGAEISRGGTADGILPVFKDFVTMADNVSQGSTRRGAWAGYVPMSHPDFWEVALEVLHNPDGSNVGWNMYDTDVEKLNCGDAEQHKRWQEIMYVKGLTGKGYFYFPDKVRRHAKTKAPMYKELGLSSKASNLCTEITLHSDERHSYTCVLSGMCLTTYDEWKDTDAVFCMTVFTDCLVSEFLESAKQIKGLEKVVRGTEKGRALGVGMTGYHSAIQQRMFPWDSFEAHKFNMEVSKHLQDETLRASQWMAKNFGEPEWCKGHGVRNTHRTALAPNVSSSLIFGSESQGINPWYGNVYNEGSASGALFRVNPFFIEILKKHNKYNDEVLKAVLHDNGSVQSLDFLTDLEKEVLKTHFELNQMSVCDAVSRRQRFICQAQSFNLAFAAEEKEEVISEVYQRIVEDENIHSAYYMRSKSGVNASTGAACGTCES